MDSKGYLGQFLAVLFSLAFFFVLLEVSVRLYTRFQIFYDVEMTRYAMELKEESSNRKIGHFHHPNRALDLMGVRVETNGDGLRDSDYPLERRPGVYRIAVLGDSLTFGWGVEKEDSFESLLENRLQEHQPVEMLNFAAGNFNTEQQVNLFLEKGLKYQPDKVLLFYFINDAEPTPAKSGWEFFGHSRAITFLWSRINAALANYSTARSFRSYYQDLYNRDNPGWQNLEAAFRTLREVTRERGMALQVVILPELHDLQSYPFQAEQDQVAQLLADLGIDYLDITPQFLGRENSYELWVALDDAHPNAAAHAMIAEHALDFVHDFEESGKTAGERNE